MMEKVKGGMTKKQRVETANKLAKDFLEKCDGMRCEEMADILHWFFLFCMANFCDNVDMDLHDALQYSKRFIQEAINDINSKNRRYN